MSMKKTIWAMMVAGGILTIWMTSAPAQQESCDERLRQTSAMLEITRDGRDRAERALAEMFGRFQDAMKQLDETKKKGKPEGK
jgi:hypothetical protein